MVIQSIDQIAQKDPQKFISLLKNNPSLITMITCNDNMINHLCTDVRLLRNILKYTRDKNLLEACISIYPDLIKDISFQYEDLCKLCLEIKPENIEFIKNKTEKLSLYAVSKDGMLLRHIKETQTENICNKAIEQNKFAFQFIINPTPEQKRLCLNFIKVTYGNIQDNIKTFKTIPMLIEETFGKIKYVDDIEDMDCPDEKYYVLQNGDVYDVYCYGEVSTECQGWFSTYYNKTHKFILEKSFVYEHKV